MFTGMEQKDGSYGILTSENKLYFSTYDLFWAAAVLKLLNNSKDVNADIATHNLPPLP